MITVLLADDHPLILHGLHDLFTACSNIRVLGMEPDAGKVLESVARLLPDVLVLDLMMPGVSGMDIIHQVSKSHADTRIVVLSMHASVAYVWEAFRNGALAYVLKCEESDELILAVRRAGARQPYLSTSVSRHELNEYASKMQQHGLDPCDMLTRRERQVLQLVAEGNTSARIAQQLDIGIRTVETHRANLHAKLNLHNQTELVRYALQHGLIPPF